MSEASETLSVREAASRLGLSLSSGYRAARSQALPVIRVRGRWLVLRVPFERLIAGEALHTHKAQLASEPEEPR